jgi:hypothetical protein
VFTLAKLFILCILCDEPCWASQWRRTVLSLPASYTRVASEESTCDQIGCDWRVSELTDCKVTAVVRRIHHSGRQLAGL